MFWPWLRRTASYWATSTLSPPTRFAGAVQGSQRADRSQIARVNVAHILGGRERRHAGKRVDVHQPSERLGDGIVGRSRHVGVFARLAEAGDVHDDESRIRPPQLLIGQAPAIVLPAFRGLDKDIRVGEHLQKNFAALFRGDIERHRAHIAAVELDRPALMEAAASRDVGRFRVLDPDDVGAHVGHELRAKRTSDRNGRMYHLHALERAELGNISSSHNSFSLRLFLHFSQAAPSTTPRVFWAQSAAKASLSTFPTLVRGSSVMTMIARGFL